MAPGLTYAATPAAAAVNGIRRRLHWKTLHSDDGAHFIYCGGTGCRADPAPGYLGHRPRCCWVDAQVRTRQGKDPQQALAMEPRAHLHGVWARL